MDPRTAASSLIELFDDNSRQRLIFDLADEKKRLAWFYTPEVRDGIAIREMTTDQRAATLGLLSAVLSTTGYARTYTIMALESILDKIEGGTRNRDPQDYHLWFFGRPADPIWAWRFEGHHVSLNFIHAADEMVATPCFLGANPSSVEVGSGIVSRPLHGERLQAMNLLESLSDSQLSDAVISPDAPADILSGNSPLLDSDILSGGVATADFSSEQLELLAQLLDVYVGRIAEPHAQMYRNRIGLGELHFAWAGDVNAIEGHYYKVWSSEFLAEYDNTQNDANHIHSVWRDPVADWGGDVLRDHLRRHHGDSR